MKSKRKLIKKLAISIATAGLLAVTCTTSTYAWFKFNSVATVENMQFSATSGMGFLVSVDGVNFSNELSKSQLMDAIVASKDNRYYFNDEGILMYKLNDETDARPADAEDRDLVLKDVALFPLTSTDGINFNDLFNSTSTVSSGRFVEFKVYFRTEATKKEDNQNYDIYLNGEEIIEKNGHKVSPTTIKSEVDDVKLVANLTTWDRANTTALTKLDMVKGDVISVHSANALRLSIEDTTSNNLIKENNNALLEADKNAVTTPLNKANIYELSDADDLGSYATKYDGTDVELNKLYNYKYNAGITYYNHIKPYAQISEDKIPEFADKVETIRSLTDVTNVPFVNVKSGEDSKLVTFRLWLEGWDADCFDGLAKSVNVKLSFHAKKHVDGNI